MQTRCTGVHFIGEGLSLQGIELNWFIRPGYWLCSEEVHRGFDWGVFPQLWAGYCSRTGRIPSLAHKTERQAMLFRTCGSQILYIKTLCSKMRLHLITSLTRLAMRPDLSPVPSLDRSFQCEGHPLWNLPQIMPHQKLRLCTNAGLLSIISRPCSRRSWFRVSGWA